MNLRKEYDAWHSKYHQLDADYDDTSTPWYEWVQRTVGELEGLRTLEVACGRAGLVRKFARKATLACGVDFSFEAVSIGKQRWDTEDASTPAGFIQGDAHALPFRDASFDFLISCETIEHLREPVTALREFHRVIRPGGMLFLTTPNYFNFMGLYEIYAKFRHPNRVPDQPLDRIQLFYQTRHLVARAGWRILRSDGTVHQFPFFPGRNPVRVRSLESIPAVRKLLSIFALTYCLVAEKISQTPKRGS